MCASWRRPSNSWISRRLKDGGRNEHRTCRPSLANDRVRALRRVLCSRVPQEPRVGPLLAVVQCFGQVPYPVHAPYQPWQPSWADVSPAATGGACDLIHHGADRRAVYWCMAGWDATDVFYLGDLELARRRAACCVVLRVPRDCADPLADVAKH